MVATFVPSKVYVGEKKDDPRAPQPGSLYINALVIAQTVLKPSENGNKIPSKRGAVALAKDFIMGYLNLPMMRFRTFRLQPGEASSLVCGDVAFYTTTGGSVKFTKGEIEALFDLASL